MIPILSLIFSVLTFIVAGCKYEFLQCGFILQPFVLDDSIHHVEFIGRNVAEFIHRTPKKRALRRLKRIGLIRGNSAECCKMLGGNKGNHAAALVSLRLD